MLKSPEGWKKKLKPLHLATRSFAATLPRNSSFPLVPHRSFLCQFLPFPATCGFSADSIFSNGWHAKFHWAAQTENVTGKQDVGGYSGVWIYSVFPMWMFETQRGRFLLFIFIFLTTQWVTHPKHRKTTKTWYKKCTGFEKHWILNSCRLFWQSALSACS